MTLEPHIKAALQPLADVFSERSEDISRFVATGNSWESWLLWEWCARCKRRQDLVTRIEPIYSDFSRAAVTGQKRADLSVAPADGGRPAVFELATVHPGNADKWIKGGKLAEDASKLGTVDLARAVPVLVVAVLSVKADPTEDLRWAARVTRGPAWQVEIPLTGQGKALLRAWALGSPA